MGFWTSKGLARYLWDMWACRPLEKTRGKGFFPYGQRERIGAARSATEPNLLSLWGLTFCASLEVLLSKRMRKYKIEIL